MMSLQAFRVTFSRGLALGMLLFLRGITPLRAETNDFYLRNGDTVVFYGDSITEQDFYCQFVELFTITRFPAMRVRFLGEGIGGDTVNGGFAGKIDERITRDVIANHASVVTIMLGMNDGRYAPLSAEHETDYRTGYMHILNTLKQRTEARITLLGPTPYDEVTGPPMFAGGYNQVLRRLSEIDRDLAKRNDSLYVDLNQPVNAALVKSNRAEPQVARLLIPDRVHPDTVVHWVMAQTLLNAWHAPSVVSSVALDATKSEPLALTNARVDALKTSTGGLTWTALEGSLPLPLEASNATHALLMSLTPIQDQLNNERLIVKHLTSGNYDLAIDGSRVATLSSLELDKGVNLADFDTPMRKQARSVSWTIRDHDTTNFLRTRMMLKKENVEAVTTYRDSLEEDAYRAAQPVSHTFALTPAATIHNR